MILRCPARAATIGLVLTVGLACAEREALGPGGADVRFLGEPTYYSMPRGEPGDNVQLGDIIDYTKPYLAWEGLVRNYGDRTADSVFVAIHFAGGAISAAYVIDLTVRPHQTVGYLVFSRPADRRIDYKEVYWKEVSEEA